MTKSKQEKLTYGAYKKKITKSWENQNSSFHLLNIKGSRVILWALFKLASKQLHEICTISLTRNPKLKLRYLFLVAGTVNVHWRRQPSSAAPGLPPSALKAEPWASVSCMRLVETERVLASPSCRWGKGSFEQLSDSSKVTWWERKPGSHLTAHQAQRWVNARWPPCDLERLGDQRKGKTESSRVSHGRVARSRHGGVDAPASVCCPGWRPTIE